MVDSKESQPSTSSSIEWSEPCRRFNFPEILLATNNFDESLVIGHGGFGKVYKGNIINESSLVVAAIKRLDSLSSQGASEFWAEVKMLSKLSRCHLVSLFGYFNHEKELILVYEYMPNGTLADHLDKLDTSLSWLQRLKICVGAGRGLHYLHTGTGIDVGVIHRDVKSSNILLHESWAAKISDFGLSKIDPDYFFTGRLTRKSDVYAFGVVLLEVLCRKRAVDESLDEVQWNLARWAQESIKEGNLKHIIDSGIKVQISPKCLKMFVQMAERCLHNNPKQRPTMAEVVVGLESVLALQEKTNNPLPPTSRKIFGRVIYKFPFPATRDNSAPGDSTLDNKDFTAPILSLRVFKYSEIRTATRNFRPDLCSDIFGGLFLCWVDNDTFTPSTKGAGISIAVKIYGEVHPNWQEEVTILEGLAHPNVTSLLGYCEDEKICTLVYKWMKNPDFGHFLFNDVVEPLSWETRLMIIIGVARGIAYIHSSEDQVVHGDVRTSNIFLDQDFNAKLRAFGFKTFGPEAGITVSTCITCTAPYLDPKYAATCDWNVKCDIYSFGVVLLETLTGEQATKHGGESRMVKWAS